MEAAIWTLIAILSGSSFGSLYYLGTKIDRQGARLEARIDRLEGRIDRLAEDVADHSH